MVKKAYFRGKKACFWSEKSLFLGCTFSLKFDLINYKLNLINSKSNFMAIKYFKLKRKIVINSTVEERYVPQMQVESPVGFEQIAEMIEKSSTVARGDILGVLAQLETNSFFMLENGHPVNLGLLGTFYPTIETESTDSAEGVTTKLIKRFKILFKPSSYLKNRLKKVSFVLGDNKVREVKSRKR